MTRVTLPAITLAFHAAFTFYFGTVIMATWIIPILGLLAGYLCGSISSAIVIARLSGLPDPREQGSGNPGATNMLRLGGKKAAALTLLGDVLKGVIPVVIARWWLGDYGFSAGNEDIAAPLSTSMSVQWVIALTALGAFIGHLYPVFFQFKGGKGVATAFGVALGMNAWLALALLLIWGFVAAATRYSSLAALIATGLSPILMSLLKPGLAYVMVSVVMAIFVFWRHNANIARLRDRTESRISFGSSKEK